ncbi:MAG TPA: N-acetyl-gamma-glutamyl-phosphate reductase [Acidimicrobiales bacterium]|nr:N-acetyl-gamma-glutamyl-phosphate reductase [Acidimicrobiales bacterium]
MVKAGVVGASGYLGAELLRLLAGHPSLEVAVAQADSSAGEALSSLYPGLGAAYGDLELSALDPAMLEGCDVVFVAVPSGRSQHLVPALLGRTGHVVDLGADFRLRDAAAYPQWYGFEHACPELLAEAAYGLPELFRDEIAGARLIAAPGCYVTAASLALAPLAAAGVVEPGSIVVDAASGSSGAGRSPGPVTQHGALNESFDAYGLLTHRHTPEMEQVIGAPVLFTPHHAPMTRGILASCYAKLSDTSPVTTSAQLLELLRDTYQGERFVRVVDEPPATRHTVGTNNVHLTARVDERTGHAMVFSALDNLTKGGAGQALQAANVALELPETAGLPTVALIP